MNELKERIRENGIDYILCGDYYIPKWEISKSKLPIGYYGRLRKEHIKLHRPALYQQLLLQDKHYGHCAEVEAQARRRLNVMMEQLVRKWNITEELKHRDRMKWVRLMNQAHHCADESVVRELIYD